MSVRGRREPASIQSIRKNYQYQIRAEWARLKEWRQLQRELKKWLKVANLSGVKIPFPEPDSSGFRRTIVDIHSPKEAYIIFSDGGGDRCFLLLASVYKDDFSKLKNHDCSYAEFDVGYACEGLLKIPLTPEHISELKKEQATYRPACCKAHK